MPDDRTFSTTSSTGTTDRRRRTLFIGAILLLIGAIVAIALGVVLTRDEGGNRGSSAGETPFLLGPTFAPSEAPSRLGDTREPSVSASPTLQPSVSQAPSRLGDTVEPSAAASLAPSVFPSRVVSFAPSSTDVPVPPTRAPTFPPIFAPLPPPTPRPTPSYTPAPTPPLSPVSPVADSEVAQLIKSIGVYGGDEFGSPDSYQSKALKWLEQDAYFEQFPSDGNAVSRWSDDRLIQRYALACVYYATYNVTNRYTDDYFGAGIILPWITEQNWMGGASECVWFRIECDNTTQTVVETIKMYQNRLTGSFPREVTLLTNLKRIDLFDNVIYNSGDEGNAWFGEMTSLEYLFYGSTYFEYDGIPTQISLLTNLKEYDCSYTFYFGELNGDTFRGLTNLEYLAMGGNIYNSPLPSELVTLPKLEWLYVEGAFLNGDLDFIADMPVIFELWMDFNLFGSSIPTTIGTVTTLASLSITESGLTGTIPTEIGNLSLMQQIWLYNNTLVGTVPTELSRLTQMHTLYISGNSLTGSVPSSVCQLTDTASGGGRGGSLSIFVADCVDEISCSCCTECKAR